MAGYTTGNHARKAKLGFLLGAALFAVGALGGLGGQALLGGLPGWERTLLFDAEVVGVALALFAPLVYGVVLPLTE